MVLDAPVGRSVRAVAVFCGSATGAAPAFADAAAELGAVLGGRGLLLVYGGGRVGLMGVVADAARAAGGRVVGVVPGFLVDRDVAHHDIDELVVVATMHERKAAMAARADAFVALPGGFGTWEELLEVVTWDQLQVHDKPVGVLDVDGYFAGLRTLVADAERHGFVPAGHRDRLLFDTDPSRLLERLAAVPPRADRSAAP